MRQKKSLNTIVFLYGMLAIEILAVYLFLRKRITYNFLLIFMITFFVSSVLLRMLAIYIVKLVRRKRYLTCPLSEIDCFGKNEFLDFLTARFSSHGFSVKRLPSKERYGADLIVRKNGVRFVVAGIVSNDRIGAFTVQQVIAAKEYHRAEKAIIATNNYFSNNATKIAKKCSVELIDRNGFSK